MTTIRSSAVSVPQVGGSLGVNTESGWSSRWLRMTLAQREAVQALAASEPLLMRHHVASILQGTPPQLGQPFAETTFLDEVASAMARMDSDVKAGRFTLPCTPVELVNWCATFQQELPAAFLEKVKSGQTSVVTSPQRTTAPTPPVSIVPSRNGKMSTIKRDQEICRRGHEIVEAAVTAGESIKKALVVETLADEYDVPPERLTRVLSGARIDWPDVKARANEVKRAMKKGA